MRIGIVTTGRFHVLDLARELTALGHEVRFYSCVPRNRTRQFGLPSRCSKPLWWCIPLYALVLRCKFHWLERCCATLADVTAAMRLSRCDVLIGMSGICYRSGIAARRRFGAAVWIERGSRHVLSQKRILDALNGAATVKRSAVKAETRSYRIADVIVVPSRHVEESFLKRQFAADRIFRNPYGVDLDVFRSTNTPPPPVTLIMVGTWSRRKGCDVLAAAVERCPDISLLHVGMIGDMEFPASPQFTHARSVSQQLLPTYYERSHIAVLCSREEGLALVLGQAVACGLRVVCTDRTGGEDLKNLLDGTDVITVVPHNNVDATVAAIREQASSLPAAYTLRYFPNRDKLAWSEYGKRYDAELRARVAKRV